MALAALLSGGGALAASGGAHGFETCTHGWEWGRVRDVGKQRPILMYLLYGGSEPLWVETALSILTVLHRARADLQPRILLATDQPDRAHGWPVEVYPITDELLSEWMGPDRYNHRVKNRALAAVMDENPEAPVCLVDGDTIFLDDAARLFERIGSGRSVMHADEGSILERFPETHERLRGLGAAAEPFFREGMHMTNSGVLGLDPSDRPLLDRSLAWMDTYYGATSDLLAEQIADGEVLASSTRMQTTQDLVFHYWGVLRPFMRSRGRELLRSTAGLPLEERVRRAGRIDTSLPPLPLSTRASIGVYRRLRGWSEDFAFVLLAAWAARRATTLREAWAELAREQLQRLRDDPAFDRRWLADPVARRLLRDLA